MERLNYIGSISERTADMVERICQTRDIFSRFTTAPASSKFHCNFEGGLYEHSMNVFDVAINMSASIAEGFVTAESIAIAAVLHDIGKIGTKNAPYYSVGSRGGVSVTKGMLPHELLSVQWAQKLGIKLTPEEYNAILFHNGLYTPMGATIKGREEPLTLIIQWADMWASRVVEVENGREE